MCFSIRQALFKVLFTLLKSVINKKQQKKIYHLFYLVVNHYF
ncbi:hypothetical protein RV08_GL002887 [Enterococcus mundtii]|nr:hypothetical protein RV08_GL002887 [Enterococcus mundtii]